MIFDRRSIEVGKKLLQGYLGPFPNSSAEDLQMAAPCRAIGVVGLGFVGRAVAEHFSRFYQVYGYDSGPAKNRLRELFVNGREVGVDPEEEGTAHWASWLTSNVDGPIFICVPTPAAPDGRCDTSIVRHVVEDLAAHSADDYRNVAVIKSTVAPGTTDAINDEPILCRDRIPKITCVHNPEFLTERTAAFDFSNQRETVIGGPGVAAEVVGDVYRAAFPRSVILLCSGLEAEFLKYTRNCFYAVKLAYANEIAALCQRLGVDYDRVRALSMGHPWMGGMHWQVPGPDGKLGFGGKCLPKDLAALIHLCQEHGVNCETMLGAAMSNAVRRPDDEQPAIRGPYRSPC